MTLAEWRKKNGEGGRPLSLLDAGELLGLSGTTVRLLEMPGSSPTLRTVDLVEAATKGAVRREDWPSEVDAVAKRLKVVLVPPKRSRRRR
jgi:hypothetical protein